MVIQTKHDLEAARDSLEHEEKVNNVMQIRDGDGSIQQSHVVVDFVPKIESKDEIQRILRRNDLRCDRDEIEMGVFPATYAYPL